MLPLDYFHLLFFCFIGEKITEHEHRIRNPNAQNTQNKVKAKISTLKQSNDNHS